MTRRTLLIIAADLLAVFVPIWRAWRVVEQLYQQFTGA